MNRKALLLILVILIVALVAGRGRRAAPTPVQGDVTLVVATPGGLCWVERQPAGGAATLYHAASPRAPGRSLATATDVRSVVVSDGALWYLTDEETPAGGKLWRVDMPDGAPRVAAEGLRAPQGLLATGEAVCWAETRPSPVPSIACVPLLQPLSLLYRADANAQNRRLLAVVENGDQHFAGKLVGEREGWLYWLQQSGTAYNRPVMAISRVPVEGGTPEELVRTRGVQDALVSRQTLYWTAPSEEMSPPHGARTVRRMPLGGGEPETLTDWMSFQGGLLLIGDRPYYGDGAFVWRIPSRLGEAPCAATLKVAPTTLATDGASVYGFTQHEGKRGIARCPLTLAARLRGLLGRL